MKAQDIALKYLAWAKANSGSIIDAERGRVFVSTTFPLPAKNDESLIIEINSGRSAIALSDAGHITSFLHRNGIDLNRRKDALFKVEAICKHNGLEFVDGELRAEVGGDDPASIHRFCTNLIAIASVVYTTHDTPLRWGAQRHKPQTRLFNYFREHELPVSTTPLYMSQDVPRGVIFRDYERPVSGIPHKYPFYLENGSTYAIDTIDYAAFVRPESAKEQTFEVLAISQKEFQARGGTNWVHYLVYTKPTDFIVDAGLDPIEFLRDSQGPILVDIDDEEAKGEMRQKLSRAVSLASQSMIN